MGGTRAYRDPATGLHLPPLVKSAVNAAQRLGFELCVRPEIRRLLGVLAGGLPEAAVVGETGTGTGAGLAWMASNAPSDCRFVSYELDADRAAAARQVFEHIDNVEIVTGDSSGLFDRGPFDLLVLDGGPGSGKTPGDHPVEPAAVLRPGGAMTIDDYTPASTWPPTFNGEPDQSRIHWLNHPDLRATEVKVATDLAVVIARYLP